MIGLPEILILVVLFLVVAGPVTAGVVVWKYLIKPNKKPPRQSAGGKELVFASR